MIKAEKTPSGKYRARATYYGSDGKQHSKSFTEKTAAKAVAAAEKFQEEYRYNTSDTTMTLAYALKEYINIHRTVLSPSTISGYETIARTRFISLQVKRVSMISHIDIQKAINDEYNSGISPKTIKNAYSLLCSALKTICGIQFNQVINLPKEERKQHELPSKDIIPQIIKAADGTGVEVPVAMALTLGMRMSEIRGLKWEDYDGRQLYIHGVKLCCGTEDVYKETTKTAAGTRYVTVSDYLKNLLDNSERTSEWIVPMTHNAIYKRYSRALQSNGLPKMSFHFLRHINASLMTQLKIPDRYAMEMGGWATNNTYKYVYTHTISEESKQYRKLLNDNIDSLLNAISKE